MIAKIAEIRLLLDKNDIKYTADFKYLNNTQYIYPFYLISIVNENRYANLQFYNDFILGCTGKTGEKNAAVWKVKDINETVQTIKTHLKKTADVPVPKKLDRSNIASQLVNFIKTRFWKV